MEIDINIFALGDSNKESELRSRIREVMKDKEGDWTIAVIGGQSRIWELRVEGPKGKSWLKKLDGPGLHSTENILEEIRSAVDSWEIA